MGTRSLTRVIDKSYGKAEQLVCMYRQMDGYPSGHGDDLANFLGDIVIVNGIGMDHPKKIANGAGCLAAQLVAAFKEGPGSIYLYPTNTKDAGQDYEYDIVVNGEGQPLTIGVYRPVYTKTNYTFKGRDVLFTGDVAAFKEFCNKEDT